MRKHFIIISAVIISLLFASGAYSQNFIKVTKSNQGQTINLAPDQVLEISLPCNPSTGFGWYAASTTVNKSLETVAQAGNWEFIPYSKDKIAGQPGDQVIRFIGVSSGTTNLRLEYKRPWEINKATDEYTITIISEGKFTGSYIPVQTQAASSLQPVFINEPVQNNVSALQGTSIKAHPVSKQKKFSAATATLPSSFSW